MIKLTFKTLLLSSTLATSVMAAASGGGESSSALAAGGAGSASAVPPAGIPISPLSDLPLYDVSTTTLAKPGFFSAELLYSPEVNHFIESLGVDLSTIGGTRYLPTREITPDNNPDAYKLAFNTATKLYEVMYSGAEHFRETAAHLSVEHKAEVLSGVSFLTLPRFTNNEKIDIAKAFMYLEEDELTHYHTVKSVLLPLLKSLYETIPDFNLTTNNIIWLFTKTKVEDAEFLSAKLREIVDVTSTYDYKIHDYDFYNFFSVMYTDRTTATNAVASLRSILAEVSADLVDTRRERIKDLFDSVGFNK